MILRKSTKLNEIEKQLSQCFNPQIICHPENFKLLLESFPKQEYTSNGYIFGIDIIQNEHLPIYFQEWRFPADPYVEYEKSDEVWAIPLRFGYYQDTLDRAFFIIDKVMFYQPYNYIYWKPNSLISNV